MSKHRLDRIRKSWHFRKILSKGKRFRGNVIRAKYIRNTLGRIRLGFSVSAKTGNAVQRNLFKRRLRQYSVEKRVLSGYDAVIFPQVPLEGISWEEMKKDMEKLSGAVEESEA